MRIIVLMELPVNCSGLQPLLKLNGQWVLIIIIDIVYT